MTKIVLLNFLNLPTSSVFQKKNGQNTCPKTTYYDFNLLLCIRQCKFQFQYINLQISKISPNFSNHLDSPQGICSNIYGPTWLDLKSLMNTTLERMSLSISLRAAFFCAGAIIGGFIYKLIDRGALYPIFILTKGLCVALIPLYANFHTFLSYSAIIGLVSGAADTSVNVWVIDIWQDKSAPFVQALQFFWAVGFIVSPLISNPFLSPDSKAKQLAKLSDNVTAVSTSTMSSISERLVAHTEDLLATTTTELPLTRSIPTEDLVSLEEHLLVVQESKLYIPYAIAGSICLIGSISLLVIYAYRKVESLASNNAKNQDQYSKANQVEQSQIKKVEDKKEVDEFDSHPELEYSKSRCYLIQIMLFCCIMTSVFCASEMVRVNLRVKNY